MRLIFANLTALFLATAAYSNAVSNAPSGDSVQLNVLASIEVPGRRSSKSVIIISTLERDDVKYVEFDPYRISLSVTDKRLNEFSMQLTIFDQTKTARDTVTLLASLEKEGRFEFSFDDVAISGTVRIVKIVQPRANLESEN